MNREFNNLIVKAIKRAKTAPISNVQDFARMVSSAEEQLSRIYQKNPEIDKEKTNKEAYCSFRKRFIFPSEGILFSFG